MTKKERKDRDKIIKKLHKEGMDVFYISHYLGITRGRVYQILGGVDKKRLDKNYK